MTSKLLDYVRPGRKNRAAIHSDALMTSEATGIGTHEAPPLERSPAETRQNTPATSSRDEPPGHAGPLDYPSIANWLKRCEEDLERGRDGHAYSSLAVVFALNGCTRIDDIARMKKEEIKELSLERDVDASVGLINRVLHYATEDVARVKKFGKLSL